MSACWCGGKKQPKGFAHYGSCVFVKPDWTAAYRTADITEEEWMGVYDSIVGASKEKRRNRRAGGWLGRMKGWFLRAVS